MAETSLITRNCEKLWNKYSNDNSVFLLHTALMGYFLSCLGQVGGIFLNDKISKEKKKFLVPQEIADGAINMGIYYLITSKIISFSKSLFDTGKIVVKNAENLASTRNGFATLASVVGGAITGSLITPYIRNLWASYRQNEYLESVKKNNVKRNDIYQKPVSMANYMNFTKTNMRV